MNPAPSLPEGFTDLLDSDAELLRIWNGTSHGQAGIRDKQLAMYLKKLKTFSFTEARAVLLLSPHGTRRNGSELDETLKGAGFRPPPKLMTLGGLAKIMPETTKRFLWEPWLPVGLMTVLAGEAGEGKSAVALELSRRLMAGDPMPGGGGSLPMETVVWADTESSQGILLDRARSWKLPLDRFVLPLEDPLGDFRIDNREHWARLGDVVQAANPGLVVVDSLRGAHTKDENNSDALQEILSRLANLARDYSIAVLVLHHLRKKAYLEKSQPVSLDHLRGSNAIGAMARVVWGIDRPAGSEDVRRLSVIKSNLSAFPEPIGFEIGERGVSWCDAPTEPRAETILDRAIEFLSSTLQRGAKPAADLHREAELAGISAATLRRAREKLKVVAVKQGGTGGPWIWSLPARQEHWSDRYDR